MHTIATLNLLFFALWRDSIERMGYSSACKQRIRQGCCIIFYYPFQSFSNVWRRLRVMNWIYVWRTNSINSIFFFSAHTGSRIRRNILPFCKRNETKKSHKNYNQLIFMFFRCCCFQSSSFYGSTYWIVQI